MDYQAFLKTTGKYEEPAKVEPKEEPKKEIDWEQRRYEIAKTAQIGLIGTPIEIGTYRDPDVVAFRAVEYADALINELKKTSK